MKVHITTSERTKGFIGKETQYVLNCTIDLTSDEARLLPISGNPHSELTNAYTDEDEFTNVIKTSAAVNGGSECWFRSVGQLRESEEVLKARCREIQVLLNTLVGFKIEKSYTFDPSEGE